MLCKATSPLPPAQRRCKGLPQAMEKKVSGFISLRLVLFENSCLDFCLFYELESNFTKLCIKNLISFCKIDVSSPIACVMVLPLPNVICENLVLWRLLLSCCRK